MQYKKIQKTDLEVSTIALGTWVFGGDMWNGSDEAESIAATHAAIDSGINFIDTAPIYGSGRSEEIVGKAIKGKRDKLVIATKCGLTLVSKQISISLKPAAIMGEVEQSLKRLQTDYIDIYQCHWPDKDTPIEDTCEALLKLKKQGKIKYIGVSNFSREELQKANTAADVVTLQSQYSILERNLEEEIIPFCLENNIGLLAYGALGGGILTGKYKTKPNFQKSDARSYFYNYYKGEGFEKCQELIKELEGIGKPTNQTAINWVRQQPVVSSVLVGARKKEQALANAEAAKWDLSEDQLNNLNSNSLEFTRFQRG